MAPVPCRKATWRPCGALGLPMVDWLPLPDTPELPLPERGVNVHGDPLGLYWKTPLGRTGVSNPPSARRAGGANWTLTESMRAVLSLPLGLRPTKRMVWLPAATLKLPVV